MCVYFNYKRKTQSITFIVWSKNCVACWFYSRPLKTKILNKNKQSHFLEIFVRHTSFILTHSLENIDKIQHVQFKIGLIRRFWDTSD